MEPPAHGVRDTDTAAHIQARNAADAYPVGGDRRPGEGSAQARVHTIDTRASARADEQEVAEIMDRLVTMGARNCGLSS